jgi:phospholipid/cholesterol/gamma-HCH transport system ATP-binding protein
MARWPGSIANMALLEAASSLASPPVDAPGNARAGDVEDGGAVPPPGAMIYLDRVNKGFNGRTVLDGVTLAIPRGKISVVMGGSGHGKSTILKLIVGFMPPDGGQIYVDGRDITHLTPDERLEVQKTIGMSFQYSALFDSMDVYENVAFPLREHTRLKEPEIRERVKDMLARLDLAGIEEKLPSELSGGMRKRVGVARAIMLQPKIMLFDEPESGLDPITTTSIGELIMGMRDTFKITCLVISHNLQNIMHIADRIFMLYKGHILAQGSPDEVRASLDPIVQQFLSGSSHGPY